MNGEGKDYKERMPLLACHANQNDKTFSISYWKSENPNHSKNPESCPQDM